ncbi:type I secretion system permease/ATPase [Asticcacaulis sp.]|uniref:type I secretion system permease/ATPase n=1 Tax=Asticcacaulis sp. TaxID=1872648 RepID=UPI003F7C4695
MIHMLTRFKVNPTLGRALAQCRLHFTNAAVFSFFINVLSLAPTLYMLQVYGRVVPTGGVMTLVYLTVILLVSLATLSILDSLRGRLLMRSGVRLDRILAGEVLNHLYARGTMKKGMANTTLLREFDAFRQVLSGQGMTAVFDLPWIVIFLGLAFYLHSLLGWLSVAGGLLLAIVTWLSERASYQFVTRSAETMAAAYARQDATSQKADVVRALGMRRALVEVQLKERHGALDDQIKASLSVSGYSTASKFIRQFLQSVALGVGAWLAIHQQISAGAIFAASLLMSRALTPMEQVITSWRSLIRGYNAFRAVDRALNEQDDGATPLTALPAPQGLVEIDGLTVPHPDQKAFILQGISLRVLPGELVGVAGPSGVGKSTLARLIVGADTYEVGTIRFDGAERRDWDSEKLARHIGYLPQDSTLFGGTVRDNICRFETAADGNAAGIDEAVVAAAKLAGVHEMILQLPKGYNTVLGLSGQGLSGGQAQRVALARALYRDPAVLVLDEPNAYLDSAGEIALIEAMAAVCKRGGSVIIIAHRTSVLERASKLLMLANGRVQFFGTPQQWAEAVTRQRGQTSLAPIAGGKAGMN